MWNYLFKLYSIISGIWYGLKIVDFLPIWCSLSRSQAFSPIVVALPACPLCWHILPLKLCLTPCPSQAQLKHHLLQTPLDSGSSLVWVRCLSSVLPWNYMNIPLTLYHKHCQHW